MTFLKIFKTGNQKKARVSEQITKAEILSTGKIRRGIRIFLVIALTLIAVIVVTIGQQLNIKWGVTLHIGDIAPRPIYADRDFSYLSKEETETRREELVRGIRDVYDLDSKFIEETVSRAGNFFSALRQLPSPGSLEELKKTDVFGLSEVNLNCLNELGRREEISSETAKIIKDVLSNGILSDADKEDLIKREISTIVVREPLKGTELHQDILELLVLDSAERLAASEVIAAFPEERRLRLALTELIRRCLAPTLKVNSQETKHRRDAVIQAAPLEYREVKKGELIVDKGQRVSAEQLSKLVQMGQDKPKTVQAAFFLGIIFLVIICIGVVVFYLKMFHAIFYYRNKYLVLISLLVIIILLISKGIIGSRISNYFIPVSFVSMVIAIMVNYQAAVMITTMVCILIAVMAGGKLDLFVCSLLGSLVGIYLVQGVRRRTHLLKAGLYVGLANFVTIVSFEMVNSLERYYVVLEEGFFGIANGFFSAFLVMGVLPLFENFFKITTDISLLELSDLNHPVLKKLLLEAPGTYHHSLLVGNLSESAAEAVSANPLLARVGSYFHDIGKIEKSEYFDENQRSSGRNRHEKLLPSMSSLIIINHVKDGVETARRFKLNQVIINIIRQHHGTGLVSFFYQKALESGKDDDKITPVPEQSFRYPGPKPQTKEAAIVLLADSVEAASRSLSNPTPASIRGIVQKVINNKFIDGQLDECDLTLKDLHKITDVFVHILRGIYHSRAGYPEPGEARAKRAVKNNGKDKKPSKKD